MSDFTMEKLKISERLHAVEIHVATMLERWDNHDKTSEERYNNLNKAIDQLDKDIKGKKTNGFVRQSVKFLWGVIVLLWGAIVILFQRK